jgi:hypothetical protein
MNAMANYGIIGEVKAKTISAEKMLKSRTILLPITQLFSAEQSIKNELGSF